MTRHPLVLPLLVTGVLGLAMCRAEPPPLLAPATAVELAPCTPPAATAAVRPLQPAADFAPLTPEQRDLVMTLLAIFENRELELQYGYAETLDDGRGYTAGIFGFTTATSDALEVLLTYQRLADRRGAPDRSAIVDFVPVLEEFEALPMGDPRRAQIEQLRGFPRAWAEAARDPVFREAQDSVAESMYVVPALRFAASAGLQSALGRAAVIDAIVQHGGGEDPDGLPAMLAATVQAEGRPATLLDERRWLAAFLDLRDDVLYCAHGAATRAAWRESRTRVDVYRQVLDAGNLHLVPPLTFRLDSREWAIEER